ncbi:MAG: hypothetical protein ACJA1A_000691 [Saprospiraceae bacterium]|jgi:hypothetical protein
MDKARNALDPYLSYNNFTIVLIKLDHIVGSSMITTNRNR